MHIDAFFEYCMGLPHVYYTQLPPSGPFVSECRDGVLLEEDLALRALVPQWKPKRGRKRVEDRCAEEDKTAKRPQLDTSVGALQQSNFQSHSVTFPQSAIPFSAFPDDMESHDPWIAATSSFPNGSGSEQQSQDLRWRLPERDASPTNYPQSAIVPRSHLPSDVLMSTEPRSAVTPSSGDKSRSRRRHGPAVSSAWPNSNGMSAGKGRGRPPNKGLSSGSFSTFQVNPSQESSQVLNTDTQTPSHVLEINSSQHSQTSPYNQTPTPVTQGRPNKLQLQVPQHSGAPVRLATPPRLVVNGVNGAMVSGLEGPRISRPHPSVKALNNGIPSQIPSSGGQSNANAIPNPSIEDILRVLSAELLRARLIGRTTSLRPDEADSLASAMVINLSSLYSQLQISSPSLLAFHLGIGHHFKSAGTNPGSLSIKIERVIPHINGSRDPSCSNGLFGGFQYTISHEYKLSDQFSMRVVLATVSKGIGGADNSDYTNVAVAPNHQSIEDTRAVDLDSDDEDPSRSVSEATWKQRYTRLRAQMQKRDQALSQYKRKIVESVMADI